MKIQSTHYNIRKNTPRPLEQLLLLELTSPLAESTPTFKRIRNTSEDIETFKDELPSICRAKIIELNQSRKRLEKAQGFRKIIIKSWPEILKCELHALVGAYSLQAEATNIDAWVKYWRNLNPERKRRNFKKSGFSDSDLEKARNYPIENLLPVPPRPAGAGKLKTLCPFHEERSPSFIIYTNENSAHCYGCGLHFNNALDFLMRLEELNFKEVMRRLL